MKTVMKILLAIIIVVAIVLGIYCVLPETSKMFIKGNIQYRTDDTAKEMIDKVKANEIKYTEVADNGTTKTVETGVTYGDALEKAGKSTAWYYEEAANGNRTITYYGSKVSLDLAKYGEEGVYVDKTLKVVFYFPADGSGSTVTLYYGDSTLDGTARTAALQALSAK
jgi:uncharacterized protein YxeA